VWVGARARAYACARVSLLIQQVTRRSIVICDQSVSTTFPTGIIKGSVYGKMLLDIKCVF
jgi:hypothetical protein